LKAPKPRRYLLDSTLREGEQTPGVAFTAEQKLKIAELLDAGGVHQIEAGIPAAGRREKELISKIIKNRKNAVVSVWARMSESDIRHAIDVTPDIIHISVPVSYPHIYAKLKKNKTWVINRLRDCLDIMGKSGIRLSVGFEDAFRSEASFMLQVARILLDFGVTRIRLADTVGVADPTVCREVIRELSARLDGLEKKAEFGIHAHNDLGMAVANTIEAVKNGCIYADVTAGGIGERAGNCDLAKLAESSSHIFDWGITAQEAARLQRDIIGIINFKEKKL